LKLKGVGRVGPPSSGFGRQKEEGGNIDMLARNVKKGFPTKKGAGERELLPKRRRGSKFSSWKGQ